MSIPDQLYEESALWRSIMDHHTNPEEAGAVFAESGVKLAVYSHIIVQGYDSEEEGIRELIQKTKKNYGGEFYVGEDLMTIEINDLPEVIYYE